MQNEKKFMTIDDDLFYQNSLIMFNEFNKNASFGIMTGLLDSARNNDEDINIFINSYGGAVDDLTAMIDTMNLIKNDVATIGLGCCASCGAMLLACGTPGKRYITENARVMIHQVSSGTIGTVSEMQVDMEEAKRLNDKMASILAKATKKSKKQILEDIKADKWFTAEEALEYGLVDKIIKQEDIKKMPLEEKKLDRNNDKDFVFNYELKAFDDSDDKYYYLEGYASTPDVDLCNDIMEQDALIKSLEKYGSPSFLHQHNQSEKPLGVIESAKLDNGKTYIKARMPKGIKAIEDVVTLIKEGAYKGLSVGYSVLDYHYKNNVRIITDIIWLEVSLVSVPANQHAKLISCKSKEISNVSGKKLFENAKSLKNVEEVLKEKGLSKSETLTCISKIKELSLNKDTSKVSDLPNESSVSDLQTYLKDTLTNLQSTINKTLGK